MHTRYPTLPGQQKKRRPSRVGRFVRKRFRLIVIASLILVVAVLFYQKRSLFTTSNASDGSSTKLKKTNGALEKGTPKYQTYLPSGKNIKDYGGWTRVSPPERNPVYAYSDTIGKVPIIVSQQPLPEELQANTLDAVEQLAQGYSANQKIKTKDVTIFVGTSAKGPQSIIFAEGKTLVLIKSSAGLSNDALVKYVESLTAG